MIDRGGSEGNEAESLGPLRTFSVDAKGAILQPFFNAIRGHSLRPQGLARRSRHPAVRALCSCAITDSRRVAAELIPRPNAVFLAPAPPGRSPCTDERKGQEHGEKE